MKSHAKQNKKRNRSINTDDRLLVTMKEDGGGMSEIG